MNETKPWTGTLIYTYLFLVTACKFFFACIAFNVCQIRILPKQQKKKQNDEVKENERRYNRKGS